MKRIETIQNDRLFAKSVMLLKRGDWPRSQLVRPKNAKSTVTAIAPTPATWKTPRQPRYGASRATRTGAVRKARFGPDSWIASAVPRFLSGAISMTEAMPDPG